MAGSCIWKKNARWYNVTRRNRIILTILAAIFIFLIMYGAVSLRENNTWMMYAGIETEETDSVYEAESVLAWHNI